MHSALMSVELITFGHGLWTPREEKAFTARPKIHSHSQIFRYGRSIFRLPLRPNFSDIFDLCLHWVSVVRGNVDEQYIIYYALNIPKKLHSFHSALQCNKGDIARIFIFWAIFCFYNQQLYIFRESNLLDKTIQIYRI